jgi:outer membrane immunogenic protein
MRIGVAVVIASASVAIGFSAAAQSAPPQFAGAYIGLNAGAAWGSSSYATNPNCVADAADGVFCVTPPDPSAINGTAVAASGSGDLASSGFTGGVQAGYNWQSGNIVFGGEGDFGAFSLGDSTSPTGAFPSPFLGTAYSLTESMSTSWLATFRGRLGYTVTPELLLYVTGGLAFTDFKFSSSYSDNAVSVLFPGGTGFGSRSEVKTGWTLGGGGEWLLDGPWSIKAEYLYLDFGSVNVPVALSNTPAFTQTMQVEADLSAQVARVGVNYRP